MTERPIRVVHPVWRPGFGGIERFVTDLARVQAASGETTVAIVACGTPPGDPSLARYAAPGVTVTGGGLRSGFDVRPGRVRALTAMISEADVIHVHGYTPAVVRAVLRARRPIVFTEHGLLSLNRRRFSRATVKQAAKGHFLRHSVSTVACVSQWIAEAVRRLYCIDEDRVRLVPDGADFKGIRAVRPRDEVLRAEGVDPAAWVMVVTARLVDFKRIDRLLDAAARLREDGRDWVLLLAGDGPLEPELRRQAATLGMERNVRFLGFRDNVWDLVRAADLVPMPSRGEAFGLVVLEALALDRPVAAFTDSGGPAEVIRAVGGGCLVDTIEEFAAVLDQSRRGLPITGLQPLDRDRLQTIYSIESTAANYARLYREALADPFDASGRRHAHIRRRTHRRRPARGTSERERP